MRYLLAILGVLGACLTVSGEQLSLNDFAAKYGFPAPALSQNEIAFRSRYTEMVFKHDSRIMRYNGMLIWMCAGAYAGPTEWKVDKADAEAILAPLLRALDYTAKVRRPRLVLIDPGHGGAQTGARPASGLDEKRLTLDLAIRMQEALSRKGIRSVLTRDRDVELDLAGRSRKIGALSADLFVSIHLNSAGNPNAKGIETYALPVAGFPSTSGGKGSTARVVGNRNDALNSVLSYIIQRDILKSTCADDRGLKRARFDVLSNATCPAVLVECGFLSNTAENRLLQQSAYRAKLADGLASGVAHYIAIWDQK